MSEEPYRIIENQSDPQFLSWAAAQLQRPPEHIRALLEREGARLAINLGIKASPLSLHGRSLRAENIAGLFRLAPGLEVEVVPKYLAHLDGTSWRQDFYFLAMLSRFGVVLPHDALSSQIATEASLADLIGRAIASMYTLNAHRPLRQYAFHHFQDFALVGELDYAGGVRPGRQGFRQTRLNFSQANPWMDTIRHAAHLIAQEVRAIRLKAELAVIATGKDDRLMRIVARTHNETRLPPVPNRHSAWSPLVALAESVVQGRSTGLGNSKSALPGFVVQTWQLWEELLGWGLKGSNQGSVESQPRFALGTRHTGLRSRTVTTTPDFRWTPNLPDNPPILVDAKYKGRPDREHRISEADLYESLAFSQSSETSHVILIYPDVQDGSIPTGLDFSVFETIRVQEMRVTGCIVNVGHIRSMADLIAFGKRLTNALESAYS